MTKVNPIYKAPLERPQPSLSDIKRSNNQVIASTSGPGAMAVFQSPRELKISIERIQKAVLGLDLRLALQGLGTFASHSFSAVYSFFTLGSYFSIGFTVISFICKNLKHNLSKIATVTQAVFRHPVVVCTTLCLGSLISIINGAFETIGLYKQIKFRRLLNSNQKNTQAQFDVLINYLDLTDKQKKALARQGNKSFEKAAHADELDTDKHDAVKRACHETRLQLLSEIVGPWLAVEIADEVFKMRTKLDTADEKVAVEWLEQIYELMDIQSKKALLIHSLGLAAIAAGVLATIMSFVAFPGAVPIFALLVVLSVSFATARYVVHSGYYNSRGWTFRPINMVPVALREISQKVIKAVYESKDLAFSSSFFYDSFGCSAGSVVPA